MHHYYTWNTPGQKTLIFTPDQQNFIAESNENNQHTISNIMISGNTPIIVIGSAAPTTDTLLAIQIASDLQALYTSLAGSQPYFSILDTDVSLPLDPNRKYILAANYAARNTVLASTLATYGKTDTSTWQSISPNIVQISSNSISTLNAYKALYGQPNNPPTCGNNVRKPVKCAMP